MSNVLSFEDPVAPLTVGTMDEFIEYFMAVSYTHLVQLVGDERTSSGWFALLLCVTQVLVAPLAFYAGGFIAAQSNPAQLLSLIHI